MSVPLPAFRRVRLTQQCVIHPQDKGGNYLPCALEDWVLFVSLAADEEKIILRTEHRCLPIEPGGALLLPLIETGEALGWTAESEELTEETQIRRSVALTKDNSKISVTWMVRDTTASAITWLKDGLLIPVDTRLTTLESVVYVPAAFFEEAMDASVMRKENAVEVSSMESTATPETMPQEANKTE